MIRKLGALAIVATAIGSFTTDAHAHYECPAYVDAIYVNGYNVYGSDLYKTEGTGANTRCYFKGGTAYKLNGTLVSTDYWWNRVVTQLPQDH